MKPMIRNSVCKMLAFMMAAGSVFCADLNAQPNVITVGKGSGYDFESIQEAVDSISFVPTESNKAEIVIGKGTYEEPVTVDIPYVELKSETDNAQDVIITYDKANGHVDSTKNAGTEKSATFTVGKNAVGFSASGITFQNSYNLYDETREQVQAVALVSMADKVRFEQCSFIARQDTLYLKGASKGQDVYGEAQNARVYLRDCYIEGTVDYIFGDATAYFDKCRLNMAYHENGGHYTAANTTLFNIGYVFNECELTADEKYTDNTKIDLGRPWQGDYKYPNYGANTVYISCKMPDALKSEGFSAWDENTQTQKIRYYEYNSLNKSGEKLDTSSRPDWVKQLDEQQAKAYNAYNVLRGDDGWNPSGERGSLEVCSVTADKCGVSIPKGETETVKTYILPNDADSTVSFSSSDETKAKVDGNGKITAVSEGSAVITARTENGFEAYTYVSIEPSRTKTPEIEYVSISEGTEITVGKTLAGSYKYKLDSDNLIDCADIEWYAVNPLTDEHIMVQRGGTSYETKQEDVGFKIKMKVIPATKTTYGDKGDAVYYITENTVSGNNTNVFRTGFQNFPDKNWTMSNSAKKEDSWIAVKDGDNTAITAHIDENSDTSRLEYANSALWTDAQYKLSMRFNPELKGLNAESYFDIYTAYNKEEDSYYKLRITRGGNTNSLRLYLYKKAAGGQEAEIAKDESSLKDIVFQNSGEKNNWFNINISTENSAVKTEFIIDGSVKSTLSYSDDAPLSGNMAFEAYGKDCAVMLESVSVGSTQNSEDRVRIYLAGDSTVKSYGNDNTIGGWGEFLPYYFDSSKVEIINKAEGGRSSRSYINQGRLDEILEEIRPNDYLFIQFGHNDARTDENARVEHSVMLGTPDSDGVYPTYAAVKTPTPQRIIDFYADTDYPYGDTFYPYEGGTYKWYLSRYIIEARQKGAIPVIITPVSRVFFDEDGKITPHHGEDNGYVTAAIQCAEEYDCAYVDMFEITKTMYETYGEKVTQGLQNIKSDGTMDITHYNKFGSNIVTSLLIKALEENNLDVAKYAKESSRFVSKTEDLKTANLFIVGNEADRSGDYVTETASWADYISKYLVGLIQTENLLENADSFSYKDTDSYKKLIDNVSEGDYVVICFGNGESASAESYKENVYNYYIKPVTDKNAVALIATPMAELSGEVSQYDSAVRELATEYQLGFINFNSSGLEMLEKADKEAYFALEKENASNDVLNEYGADSMARLVISMLKYSSATLKDYINEDAFNAYETEKATKASFVMKIMNIITDGAAEDNFDDVEEGRSYYDAISRAKNIGIISAVSNNKFYPEYTLTRSEAGKILNKIYSLYSIDQNAYVDTLSGISGTEITKYDEAVIIKRLKEALI